MAKSKVLQGIYGKDYFHMNKNWGDGYANYDKFSSKKTHPEGWMVDEILKHKKKGKVLDVGCALGYFVSFFPDSFEKYGTDISEFGIAQAKKRFPSIHFKAANICEEKPFKEKFDVITALDVLEHTLNVKGALDNLSSMLKDDGILIAEVPVATNVHHLLAAFNRSFLTTMDSHLILTRPKAWREIIFAEDFDVIEEKKITWAGKYYPPLHLFSEFFLKKKKK